MHPDATDPGWRVVGVRWQWILAVGAIALILGVVGLFMTFALTIVSALWFGVLLLVAGFFQGFEAFSGRTAGEGWSSRGTRLLLALVYVLAGILLVMDPLGASIALTLVLGFMLIVAGGLRGYWAFAQRGARWRGSALLSAALSILLGVLILAGWPATGLWVIGLFVAIDLILFGLSWIAIGWALRGWSRRNLEDGGA